MSNHENEMLKENIFDIWVEHLELDGWPKGDLETYREAARRTEQEWKELH
jgi:hypothetical protein